MATKKRVLPLWFRMAAGYYKDDAILTAGEAAEILFVRALGYAKEQDTDGFISARSLPLIVQTRAKQRIARLVEAGLWVEVEGGWQIPKWELWQETKEQIEANREAARERAKRSRANRKKDDVSRVTHAHVTQQETETETETEKRAAAAAAARADAAAAAAIIADDLPVPVAILRSRLQSYAALSALRFDRLREDQVNQLLDLIALHGDQKLVDVALRTVRTPPPVSVAAFLGTWAALPAPGQTLAVVRDPKCALPGHQGTTRHCVQCASEVKAGGDQ
jgi:hypothetical protein